jgi:cytochrome P450
VNPNEIHFSDPDFYEEIYHGKKYKTDRDAWYNLDHIGDGLAFTLDHDIHQQRRSAIAPYFSMQSVRALEPRITEVVSQMMDRLRLTCESGSSINCYHLFSAFALDIVTNYALGKELSTNLMTTPDMGKAWAEVTMGAVPMNAFGRHFKTVFALIRSIPQSVLLRLKPGLVTVLSFEKETEAKIRKILDEEKTGVVVKDGPTTVFRELLNSDLSPRDKSLKRLADEASMVTGAGGETTAQALQRTLYHLLQHPDVVTKLRHELDAALKPGAMPSLAELQNLPYLNAVVEEGVRISFSVPARSPRIFRDHTLQYEQWTIKPGVSLLRLWQHRS